jgi:hypothetical protein
MLHQGKTWPDSLMKPASLVAESICASTSLVDTSGVIGVMFIVSSSAGSSISSAVRSVSTKPGCTGKVTTNTVSVQLTQSNDFSLYALRSGFSVHNFFVIQFTAAFVVPYSTCGAGKPEPIVMLPHMLLITTNFGVFVDALRRGYVTWISDMGPSTFTVKWCSMFSCVESKTLLGLRRTPALAMTTSRRPAIRLISSTAVRLLASSAEISLITCSLPGCSFARLLRAVEETSSRVPANTMAFSRTTRCWTKAKPTQEVHTMY